MRFADILMAAATQGGGRDPDLAAWAAAVVTNGGTVSAVHAAIVGQFIAAEKASGAWALTDDYWGLWAENEAQALTSLKQRRLATATAAPTFTTDRGYDFNGTTQYINTGFIPGTHGVNYTGTDQRGAVYERTNVSSAGAAVGATSSTSSRIVIVPRNVGNMTGQTNNSAGTVSFALSPQDSRGLKAISRAGGGTTAAGFDRGVRLTDSTGLTVGTSAPAVAVYLGGNNSGGSLAAPRACSLGFACIGGPLSDAQELAQYNAVQAWATAVGAQV